MKRIAIWILVICVVACGVPRQLNFRYLPTVHHREVAARRVIPIWIDREFGEADLVSIQEAVDQWNYALNGYVVLRITSMKFNMSESDLRVSEAQRGWLFLKIDSGNSLVWTHDRPGSWALAFTEKVGGRLLYVVRNRVENAQMTGIMLHEIGHLLGAEHLENGETLMLPMYRGEVYQCVDYATIQQVAYMWNIPVGNLNYCLYYSESSVIGK